MGLIKKTLYTGVATGVGILAYLGGTTKIVSPLPRDDALFSSASFAKYNRHRNSSTQDVCIKRIPLDKVKPELLQKEGDLVLEFCRGVWSGLGKNTPPQLPCLSINCKHGTEGPLKSLNQTDTTASCFATF